MKDRLRIATWNLEWATPGSDRHTRAIEHLAQFDADIVVTTEDSLHDWSEYPHRIDGGPDWGYPIRGARRKVIAWSRTPWEGVTELAERATHGRFVQGTTNVRGRKVQVLAVCIPWRNAHVKGGRTGREPWGEHVEFCEALGPAVAEAGGGPVIVAGDFNQRIPRVNQPRAVADALGAALVPLRVATADEHAVGRLIDHVAVSADFAVVDVEAWTNVVDGRRISDHSGVVVTVDLALA
ncbi:MAG: endonuclease/exonuclease/phosphatase family protein [Acidimicrobiales bacterium]